MDALSKRLWIAVGAVGALTIVIACVGAGAVLWLSRDGGERVRETPPPAPAAPPLPVPVPAADPIVVAVRGLGLDVIGAARGVAPARPWFASPYSGSVRLAAEGTGEDVAPLGASPELLFVTLELEAYRRTSPSHAELIEGAMLVFADGRVRYLEVHRRDMTDDFVLERLDAMQFPETSSDERMLRASVDRFLREVAACTAQPPDRADLAALPSYVSTGILDDVDPVRLAEACRAVAGAGPGAYQVRNVGRVAVFARGQGHLARLSTRFLALPGGRATLVPVSARVSPIP